MADDEELNEDLDEELEDEEVEDEEEEEESDEEADEADEDDDPKKSKKPTDKTSKRIRDLQSAKDRAEAEVRKLREQLKSGKQTDQLELDPALKQWMDEAKNANRQRVIEADPRFKEYRIDAAAIAGETPEEMRRSARTMSKLLDRMETQIRNKVLAEHGIEPSTSDSPPKGRRDFGAMSSDEFKKLLDEVRGG